MNTLRSILRLNEKQCRLVVYLTVFSIILTQIIFVTYASTDYRFIITDTIPSDNDIDVPINMHSSETGERCSVQNNYKICTINIGLGISLDNPTSGIGYPNIVESSVNKDIIKISGPDGIKIYPKYNGDQECGDCGDFYHSFFINLVDEENNEVLLKPNSSYTITIKGGDNGLVAYYDSSHQEYYAQLTQDYSWSFETGDDEVPPKISSVTKTTTNTTAKITWENNELAKSKILYGFDSSYGMTKSTDNFLENNSMILADLEQGKNYKYKIVSEDSLGNENFFTSDFTTLGIDNIQVSSINETSATITWSTNRNTDSYVEYGDSTSYGSLEGYNTLATGHDVVLVNLESGTDYNFRIKANDGKGISYSQNYTFKTTGEKEQLSESDTEVPDKPEDVNLSYNSESKTIKVTWENRDSDIEKVSVYLGYDKDFDKNSDSLIAENDRDDEDVTTGDIKEDKTYYFKLVAKDKAGNKSDTETASIHVPKDPEEKTTINTDIVIKETNSTEESLTEETPKVTINNSDSILGTSDIEESYSSDEPKIVLNTSSSIPKNIIFLGLGVVTICMVGYLLKFRKS